MERKVTSKRGFLKGLLAAPAAAMVRPTVPETEVMNTKLWSSDIANNAVGEVTIGKSEADPPTETLRHRLNYAKYRQMQRKKSQDIDESR